MSEEKNLKSAINDIAVIKQTIERAKINWSKLSSLFLFYGVSTLCIEIIRIIVSHSVKSGLDAFLITNIMNIIRYIILAVLFIYFIKTRQGLKRNNNIYTLQLYDIWGAVLFLFPLNQLFIILVRMIFTGITNTMFIIVHLSMRTFCYGTIIAALMITGIILNKRALKIVSCILSIAYPVLFIVGSASANMDTILTIYSFVGNQNSYIYITSLLIYIIIGIYLKLQIGGDKCGAE